MDNFNELNLPEQLTQSIEKMNFTKPTPIQAEAIPAALEGHDILGTAQTGTGKTAAFGLPILTKLIEDPHGSAIIITPTRELATQVMQALQDLMGGRNAPIRTALMIGGEQIQKQLRQLKAKPRLFVGTPGRINDHLKRGTLKLNDTKFLVLDEMDRMLDMGFSVQIEQIVKRMPKKRQTFLFSATLPNSTKKMAESYLNDPTRITIGTVGNPAKNIKQDIVRVDEKDKYKQLLAQLHDRKGSVIIFVKTKHGAERMAKRLRGEDHESDAIHGDLRHNKREKVIKAFRNRKYRILVATDIAARGLDIPHIEHVINYDLPQCPEDYIHRIGRTARAGAEGEALCLVTPKDNSKWHAISRMLDPSIAKEPANDRPKSGRKPRRSGGGGGYKGKNAAGGKSSGGYKGKRYGAGAGKKASGGYKGKRTEGGNSSSDGADKKTGSYKGKSSSAGSSKKFFEKRQNKKTNKFKKVA